MLMPSALHDMAFIQHNDFIGIDDGGQAMGNHQCGPAAGHAFNRILNIFFGKAIECRGRLIQYKDGRSLQQSARNRDPLFFTPRQFQSPFADTGVEAIRQRGDKAIDLRQMGGLNHFCLCRIPTPVTDIIADGVVKQHGILRHHADYRAQRGLCDCGDVLSVNGNAP